jgi:argininosuccinate lyase
MKERFPAPIYDETILEVNFEDAKKHFLNPLLEIHAAHALMLCRQRIIRRREATTCLRAAEAQSRCAGARAHLGKQSAGSGSRRLNLRPQHAIRRHVDVEDDVQPLVLSMLADALRAMRLLAGLVADTEIDKQRLRSPVSDRAITVTELADTLVREEGLSFRLAHQLVSQAVGKVAGAYSHRRMVAELKRLAPKVIQRQLKIDDHDGLKLSIRPTSSK